MTVVVMCGRGQGHGDHLGSIGNAGRPVEVGKMTPGPGSHPYSRALEGLAARLRQMRGSNGAPGIEKEGGVDEAWPSSPKRSSRPHRSDGQSTLTTVPTPSSVRHPEVGLEVVHPAVVAQVDEQVDELYGKLSEPVHDDRRKGAARVREPYGWEGVLRAAVGPLLVGRSRSPRSERGRRRRRGTARAWTRTANVAECPPSTGAAEGRSAAGSTT